MDNSTATNQQLQKENTALKEKNKTLEECLSIVAHDLRSPLTVVMILANSLEADKQSLKLIQESLERINQIIEKLLSAPKLEGENFKLDLEPFDLKEFFQNFFDSQRPLLEKAKIQFTFEDKLPADNNSITADKTHLQQVLENLISNALRFTPKDGNGKITLTVAKPDSAKISISVSDNGPGVPADKKTKIFEKFTSHAKKPSTGLGLYICQKIIELHNGKIWCEDAPGGGAKFVIEIPQQT